MQQVRGRLLVTLAGFGGLLLLTLVVAPLLGTTSISLARAFDRGIPFADNPDAQIFFVARLPRIVAAALVGGSLALAGAIFQALLRNPLATPDTLGVSSGAALGAMLAIAFHFDFAIAGLSSVSLSSLAGAIGALAIVYMLATARRRGLSTTVLLLAGVTMTAFFSALTLFVQYMSDFADTFRAVRWLMGALDVGSYTPLLAALPLMAIAFVMVAALPRPLDLISLGADAAAARGVNVQRAERLALVSASLVTGLRSRQRAGRIRRPGRPASCGWWSDRPSAGAASSALRRDVSDRRDLIARTMFAPSSCRSASSRQSSARHRQWLLVRRT